MDKKYLDALASLPPESLYGRSKYWKGFIYGEQGVGKTKVAGDCVENLGISIATDTGTDTYYNHPELLDKIKVVPYDGLSQLTATGLACAEKLEIEGFDYADVDLVIVDTVSQVAEEYLDFLNDNFTYNSEKERNKAVPRKDAVKGLQIQEVIGFPDYHLLRNQMRSPIKALIKAPVNVLFLAHDRDPSFLAQGVDKIKIKPNIPEATFKLIGREVSFIGKMERTGSKRTIKFEQSNKLVAKSRIKELDEKTINADELAEILLKWKGNF